MKTFDGRGFRPYGILNDVLVELEGKTVAIEVEFVDTQLDYNILLGRSWTYAMVVMVSSFFRMFMFPHKGKIMKVDELSYYTSDPNSSGSIPFFGKSITTYEDVGVGLLKDSSLMQTFTFPLLNLLHNVVEVNMITSSTFESSDPWKVPSKSELALYGCQMPLSPFELAN